MDDANKVLGHLSPPSRALEKYMDNINYQGEDKLFHDYWVKRVGGEGGDGFYPDFDGSNDAYDKSDAGIYGWPYKTTDKCISRVPFISDLLYTSNAIVPPANPLMSAATAPPGVGHYFNRVLNGVNLSFADGHVSHQQPQAIRTQCRRRLLLGLLS